MSRMDEGYRKMISALKANGDKVEPVLEDEFSSEEKYGIAWPPTPGPANPSAYHQIAATVADTVVAKQEAYGDSFGRSGEVLKILYPAGISRESMRDALTITRVVDKLFRVATKKDAFGESPWLDVAGYALLAAKTDSKK